MNDIQLIDLIAGCAFVYAVLAIASVVIIFYKRRRLSKAWCPRIAGYVEGKPCPECGDLDGHDRFVRGEN